MTPTPEQLRFRLSFAFQLLQEIATGLRANLADAPNTPAKRRILSTCRELDQIAGVYRQTVGRLRKIKKTGSERQPTAAEKTLTGATPSA